ncbi:hypothetical protein [Nostoc sp. NMS4]|nr:hypothetical protein [Nostoc sp. NMS4]MBN3923821.1 hypothetical protein [Nostoc sp. NMS4]
MRILLHTAIYLSKFLGLKPRPYGTALSGKIMATGRVINLSKNPIAA